MTDSGLQPLNIVLIVVPFALSLTIVALRVWRRTAKHQFAIGKIPLPYVPVLRQDLQVPSEDALLVIAEALLAALTATVWKREL